MSNALSMAAASDRVSVRVRVGGAPSASQAADAEQLSMALLAVGLCVLAIWVLRRIVFRKKFALARAPGRLNNLTPFHILAPLAIYVLLTAAASKVLERFFPPEAYPLKILVDLAGRIPLLAATLIVAAIAFRYGLRRGFGLNLRHWLYDTGRGVLGFLAIFPVCIGLFSLTVWILPKQPEQVHPMLRALGDVSLPAAWKVLVVFNAVVLASLSEELFFRGLVQSMLRRYTQRPWAAIFLTSVLFALVHVPAPQDMPALFALGVAMGYNYERCGRLYPAILIHALFNAANIVLVLLG